MTTTTSIKVAIAGPPLAGKTTLARRIAANMGQPDREYADVEDRSPLAQIQVRVAIHRVKWRGIQVEIFSIPGSPWLGQEPLAFVLQGASLVVWVEDGQEDLGDTWLLRRGDEWFERYSEVAAGAVPPSAWLRMLNKIDLAREPQASEPSHARGGSGWFRTSLVTGQGVDELLLAVERRIEQLADCSRPGPCGSR